MGRPREFDEDTVLDQAIDEFWEQGYESTGVKTLCHATGLSVPSLYAAFGDKRGLFIRALKRYMDEVSTQSIERLSGNPSGVSGIRDYFATLLDAMVDGKRKWGCLVTNSVVEFSMRDPQIAGMFQLHLARLADAFAGAIERGKRSGEIYPEASSREIATFLMCTVQGLNVLAKARPERHELDLVVRHALGVLNVPPSRPGGPAQP